MENDMAISKIKLKIGTVYQKEPNGIYYFRYQVNGARKAISLIRERMVYSGLFRLSEVNSAFLCFTQISG